MKLFYKLIPIFLITVSCAQQSHYATAYEPRIDWPEMEYKAVDKWQGSYQVSGQGFLKTRGGDVKTCAGNKVLLNPVTSYSKQFVEVNIYRTHGTGVVLTPESPDQRISTYFKETIADADGRFVFENVPAGEYYLYTSVVWDAATGYQGALQAQGGWIIKKVRVSENSNNKYILTGVEQ